MIAWIIAAINGGAVPDEGGGGDGGGGTPPSNVKQTQDLKPSNIEYQAFGEWMNTSPTLTGDPTRVTYFCRVAVNGDHVRNGYAKYIHYDVATGAIGEWQTYDTLPMPDHRDTKGIRMSTTEGIIFGQETWNNVNNTVARVATTGNITLSGLQTIDGVSVIADDFVLVKNQTSAAQNGLYQAKSGAWVRATNADHENSMSDWSETINATVNITAGTVNTGTVWASDAVAGGTLGTTALHFSTIATPHDWRSLDIYFRKFDPRDPVFTFGPQVSIYTAFPTLERLFRGEVFSVCAGASAGEFYALLFQWDDDPSLPDSPRYLVSVLHTTNYFDSGNSVLTVVDTSDGFSEGTIEWEGSGKLSLFIRDDRGGKLTVSYSSDSGATWTYPATTNLGYFGIGVKIPYTLQYKGKKIIAYQDRDSGCIMISRDNVLATYFGNLTAFNVPEIWVQNNSTTTLGNSALGYPSLICIDSTNDIFLVAWTHEYTNQRANIQFTRSKLNESPSGLPAAPPVIHSSYISSTGFRIDMMNLTNVLEVGAGQGYTPQQMENITHFIVDVATDAGFTTFPTIKWGYVIDPASQIHNFRLPATWMSLNELTPGTTYYIRIKAVNFNGESSYTSTTVTTLA